MIDIEITKNEVEVEVVKNEINLSIEKQGARGAGVPEGGTTGQILAKKTNGDFDTEWKDDESSDWEDDGEDTIKPKSGKLVEYSKIKNVPTKLSDFEDDETHRLVSDTLISNWNTTYSWGNHAGLYDLLGTASTLLSGHLDTYNHSLIATALQSETDPIFSAWLLSTPPLYSETDPIFSQWLLNTPPLYSESDPVFTSWDRSTGISITESQISDLKTYQITSEKGQNNGYAGLDAGGKVPTSQLPATLLLYKGVWNASANTPTLLATDTTKKGFVYNVGTAGTQFGIDFNLGDWAIYNDDGVLEKSDNSDDVVSVNGQQGVVVLDADDISDVLTSNKFVSATQKSNWDTAYGWGNHAVAGYWTQGGNTLGSKKTIGSIDNQDFGIITNNSERLTVLKGGNVGIGTTAPNQQLEITKNFRLPATSGTTPYGIIYKDGNSFIHDFNYGLNGNGITTTGRNTFVGLNAGNFTMGSTATQSYQASYNTAIGYASLLSNTTGGQNTANGYFSLRSNTTGNFNTAIGMYSINSNTTGNYNTASGYYSLASNTTGYYNTANGYYSLASNTTGYYNTANGMQSLYYNTTGSQNTANGMYSLHLNTTGYYNTALGFNSGRYIANGTTGRSTGNYGLYLGYNSKASADGTDNEIVIGYNAIGKGSNTLKLGSDSILRTYTDGEIIKGKEQSVVPGISFTQIADKTIGNTTTETSMFSTGVGSLNIPANSLVAGRTYRIKLKGVASGTNGDTSTIKVKLGTTELVSSTGTWQTLTDIGFTLEFDFTCRTTGATGTVAGNGYSLVSGGQGFSTVSMRALLAGTDTINTTADQVIDLTYQWSSASAGNTITITNASVEVLN